MLDTIRDSFRNLSAVGVSVVFHVALLFLMAAFKLQMLGDVEQPAVETIFTEEREQEQFTQELTVDTQVSESLSLTAGGVVSTAVGSSGKPPVSQQKIETSEKLSDPVAVNVGMIDMPSMSTLGDDLGEGEVNGETGAHVEGYGAAMSRISAELIRLMRDQPVLAVWLFDASSSLSDDREEISAQFDKIYAELNIAKERAEKGGKFESIETQICGFGDGYVKMLDEPTGDLKLITEAIGKVTEDESGKENVFGAIDAVITDYGKLAMRTKRKLAIIVVSDESGDDPGQLEECIAKANQTKSPVYFLGRESIFGYPYASVKLIDEKTKLPIWPRISRGPETAFPEALQWTGFGKRHGWNAENVSAGFGPYSQVRLARESGGIFFLLSDVEEELAGLKDQRQYDPLAMKEYEPLLLPRMEYDKQRSKSEFRDTIWKVIAKLNPNTDDELNFTWLFSTERADFEREGAREFKKAVRSLELVQKAIDALDKIQPLRARESEMRWRAAYDLVYAQLRAYQVRQFQFTLALDAHAKAWPTIEKGNTNRWARHSTGKLLEPDAQQLKATGVTLEQLEEARRKALEMYQVVINEHPGTPWALRAEREKRQGFGIGFREHFHDPRYDDIKLPNL